MDKDISKLLRLVGELFVADMIAFLDTHGIDEDSKLARSMTIKTGPRSLQVFANYYFQYVEGGRRPFVKKVPIDALIRWIKRTRIRPKDRRVTINSLAFAIQTAIYKRGIQPKPFVEPALEQLEKNLDEIFDEELDKIFQQEVDRLFKEFKVS